MSKLNFDNIKAYALGAIKQLAKAGVLSAIVLTTVVKAQPIVAAWLAKIAASATVAMIVTGALVVGAGLLALGTIKGLSWLARKTTTIAQSATAKVVNLFKKNKDLEAVASNDGTNIPMAAAA